MSARSSLVVAYAVLLWVLLMAGFLLGPWPTPWGLYLPTAGATVLLRERRYVTRYSQCADGAHGDWRRLRADAHPAAWFLDLVRPGATAASRVHGLTGLAAVDRPVYDSIVNQLTPADWAATVYVLDHGEDGSRMSLQALRADIENGTLARLFSDSTSRPEC